MANKSTGKDCVSIELSTHKVITVYALAVATIAVALSAIALRYAIIASNEANSLRKYNSLQAEIESVDKEEAKEKAEATTTTETVVDTAE